MRLKTNPSPLEVLLDGMKLHHERARRLLGQVKASGTNRTDAATRESIEVEAAKELKSAADFAKPAIAYTQERARFATEGAAESFDVEIRDFAKRERDQA